MADNKDKKVLNVPALRFPEFSDEWEKCLISDFGMVITGNTPPTKDVDNYKDGIKLWASPIDLGKSKWIYDTQTKLSVTGFEKTRKLPQGTILVTCIGSTIGKMGMATCEMATNQQINSIITNSDNDKDFVYYAIESKFPKYLTSVAIQAVPIISKSSFERLPNIRTTLTEQKKIGRFLSLIDKRIETQNKIIEDLKKLKSAIVEALFCAPKESVPAKRLSPYSKDWKLVKLFDICQRIQTKNTGRQCRQVLTIAAQYGLVNQEDFFNKTVASENLERYYLLQKGDFAYNKSYSGDYAWGAIKRLERYEQGVLSPLYICFRPNITKVDADYLAHYFESKKWYKGIADIAGEGARNHGLLNISVIDFFNTIHRIPDLEEQKVIAQFLNKFSSKLSCEQRIMQSLTKQRNYLLQKMFI